ncbi:DciA family protein [Muricoccus radiodurans]|uniref:DUF721 domain-containing protein n=1 Tax=Muricoccus radiodurans TaxID=2231721 RepID=UPI003CFAF4EC
MGSGKAGAGEGAAGGKSSPPRWRAAAKPEAGATPQGTAPGDGAANRPAPRTQAGPPARPAPVEEPRRPDLGPRPLGSLIPRLTRPAFRRKSPAGALLMADWPAVVGPAIAAVTVPLRLSSGTLTIACSGPVAMELQHLGPQLIGRINAALGSVTVQALRFVQRAPTTPPPPRPRPDRPLPEAVEGAIGTVGSPGLRDALARLARGVYRDR